MRYVFIVDIYISLARARKKKREKNKRRNAGIADCTLLDLLTKEIGSGAISTSLDFLRVLRHVDFTREDFLFVSFQFLFYTIMRVISQTMH